MLALAGDDVLARKSLGRSLPRAQAQAAQVELAPRVRASGLGLTGVRAVAGAACAGEDDNLFAAAVLLAFPTLELIDETTARATAPRRGRCRWRRSAGRRCAPEPAGGEPHGKARGQLSFHTRAVGHIGRADASDGGTRGAAPRDPRRQLRGHRSPGPRHPAGCPCAAAAAAAITGYDSGESRAARWSSGRRSWLTR